jgi:hypothetical protein
LYSAVIWIPTRQLKDFSTFITSNASGRSLSARCSAAANSIWQCLDAFSRNTLPLEGTFIGPIYFTVLLTDFNLFVSAFSAYIFMVLFCYRLLAVSEHSEKEM